MAHYDWAAAAKRRKEEEAFSEFMERIKTDPEYLQVYVAIRRREKELEELRDTVKEYKNFFGILKSFLPKSFNSSTKIY